MVDENVPMMEKGDFSMDMDAGKLKLMLDTKGVDVVVSVEADYFIDKLAEIIPGDVDDQIFAVLKVALKGM